MAPCSFFSHFSPVFFFGFCTGAVVYPPYIYFSSMVLAVSKYIVKELHFFPVFVHLGCISSSISLLS